MSTKMGKQPDIKIETYYYQTCMGKYYVWGQKLTFLTAKEQEEMDKIGYTGKNSAGKRVSFSEYLNSLGKGKIDVQQTHRNNGDFLDKYTITRAYVAGTEEKLPSLKKICGKCGYYTMLHHHKRYKCRKGTCPVGVY